MTSNTRRRRTFGPLLWSTLAVAGLAVPIMAFRDVYPRWSRSWEVRRLAAAIRDANPHIGQPAARALSQAGQPAIPGLVAALSDGDPAVRRRAAWALGMMVPRPGGALSSLGIALRDGDAEVRRRAADALGRIGPEAATQAPALRASLGDPDPNVRFGSARALGQIEGPDGDPVVRAVSDLLTVPAVLHLPEADRGSGVPDRTAAAELVRGMRPEAQGRVVAVLIPLVSSPDSTIRRAAIECLGRLGPAAGNATTALERAARSDDLVTRGLAALVLVELEGRERGRARAVLQELLDSEALRPGLISAPMLGQMRWVTTANLVAGSEIYQPVHVLRALVADLRRAEVRAESIAAAPIESNPEPTPGR